jgi:hypothetical protein
LTLEPIDAATLALPWQHVASPSRPRATFQLAEPHDPIAVLGGISGEIVNAVRHRQRHVRVDPTQTL